MSSKQVNLPSDDYQPRLALRPRQAAQALGIGERTLWARTHSGEIPHCKIGRAIVYPVDLLRKYLIENANGGDA